MGNKRLPTPLKHNILSMHTAGRSPMEIAAALCVNCNSVRSVLSRAYQRGWKPRTKTLRVATIDVNIEADALAALTAEAQRRGIPQAELAGRILSIVAGDNIFGAVLD